jgi:hypothetical protein
MTRGLSDSLTTMSSWLRWAAVAMVEAKPMAVRAARDQLAAEVEQLRVACQYH